MGLPIFRWVLVPAVGFVVNPVTLVDDDGLLSRGHGGFRGLRWNGWRQWSVRM